METESFLTAEVYCNSLISDRSEVCETRKGDFAAISFTPVYHSCGHSPVEIGVLLLWFTREGIFFMGI